MKKAFTMIELIFVIVVLGILATVAMPNYISIQQEAKIASEKQTIGALHGTIATIKAKSLLRNKKFTFYTDGPDGEVNAKILMETSKNHYPRALSIKSTKEAGISMILF